MQLLFCLKSVKCYALAGSCLFLNSCTHVVRYVMLSDMLLLSQLYTKACMTILDLWTKIYCDMLILDWFYVSECELDCFRIQFLCQGCMSNLSKKKVLLVSWTPFVCPPYTISFLILPIAFMTSSINLLLICILYHTAKQLV